MFQTNMSKPFSCKSKTFPRASGGGRHQNRGPRVKHDQRNMLIQMVLTKALETTISEKFGVKMRPVLGGVEAATRLKTLRLAPLGRGPDFKTARRSHFRRGGSDAHCSFSHLVAPRHCSSLSAEKHSPCQTPPHDVRALSPKKFSRLWTHARPCNNAHDRKQNVATSDPKILFNRDPKK